MGLRVRSSFLLVAALTLLAVSCRDEAPQEGTQLSESQEDTISAVEGDSVALSNPAFGPVFYFSGPRPDGSSYTSAFTITSARGGVYGLFALGAFCEDGERGISVYYLPTTSLDQVSVNVSVDGGPQQQQSWDVSTAYATTLGHIASAADPESLFGELASASHALIDLPQLAVGPAELDLRALFSTPVQARLERCGDNESADVIDLASGYQPIADVDGRVSNEVSYMAESLRGNRLQTTVTFSDPSYETTLGHVEFVLSCKPDGNLNVELVNLPRQTNQSRTELPQLKVVLRLDRQPPREEQWSVYSLSDGVEAGAPAPWSLMQALVRSSTLLISVPELGISAVVVDLPEMFSTPVQGNLSHCGYYDS